MQRLLWSVVAWAVLAGLYLVCAGTVDVVEGTFAVVCGGLAAALSYLMARTTKRDFVASIRPKAILHPLASILPDFLALGRQLITAIVEGSDRQRGAFVRQPFEPGGSDARSRTRRAATIIGVSLAPRTFVVRGEDSDELLLHSLPEKAASPDQAWPT